MSRSLMRTICWVTHNLNQYRMPSNQAANIVEASYQIAREGLFTMDDAVKSDSIWIIERILDSESEEVIALVASHEVLHNLADCLGSG